VDNRRLLIGGLVCATGIGAVYWLAAEVHPFGLNSGMLESRVSRILEAPLSLLRNTVLMPEFWLVIALTLTLERLLPAKPNQPWFGVAFRQDLVWFVYEAILHTIIIVTYVHVLITIYHRNFESLTIHAARAWPNWVQFAVAVLLLDLMYWVQHYVNHKVPLLWSFHSLHHSQKELNFFTDFRYHVLEYVVRHTFLVIPFLVLAVEAPTIILFAIFQRWYTRVYHGNIRTNLGPLRYVLVTPQSHRIHHSIEARHRDTNFGSLFSIWDHLFGTQCRRYDEYPDTGIEDTAFPVERSTRIRDLLLTPIVQMAYPFQRILRRDTSAVRPP
jgi:sterol desaturase/sphingolipid hydroxylase (fatty acid hydroxylase superfamily)